MKPITPCLWFAGDAKEAANFYVSLLPDSRIDTVFRSPANTPSGPAGSVLTVEFTLNGSPFQKKKGAFHLVITQRIQIHSKTPRPLFSFALFCIFLPPRAG